MSSVAHARDFIRHAMGLPGFYRVLPDATDVKWVFSVFLSCCAQVDEVLPSCCGFDWVLPGLLGFV